MLSGFELYPRWVPLTLPISKCTKVEQPKGSFFVVLAGFPTAKLLISIKEWSKKVKLGQF